MGNNVSLQLGLEGSFLLFIWETFRTVINGGEGRLYGRRRSLVRLIGSSLSKRIQLPLRVTIHPSARRSMFRPASHHASRLVAVDRYGRPTQPDVVSDLYPIFEKERTPERYRSTEKIADLEHKLNELNCLVHQLLAASKPAPDTNRPTQLSEVTVPPPPPPPPPLPLFTPMVSRLQIPKKDITSSFIKNDPRPLSMSDVLKDMRKVKLRHVERSPGGRPISRPKTPIQPADSLAEILKRRFAAIQLSPEAHNGTDSDDSGSYKLRAVPKALHIY